MNVPHNSKLCSARAEVAWVAGLAAGLVGLGIAAVAVPPTTILDFFGPGTQPGMLDIEILSVNDCSSCHGNYDAHTEPYRPSAASLMGQAARDPIFFACLAIAEQDVPFVGDLCLRCHTPGAWLEGRSTPTDGSGLDPNFNDFEGVSCNMCHRMVDPDYKPGVSPVEDLAVHARTPIMPTNPHNAYFVVDHQDNRRGPYDLGEFFIHSWLESPFHKDSAMCATCHDVSNPTLEPQPDGSYQFNQFDREHPTFDKNDMFPLERTYSEWLMSEFAIAPIDMSGRFGGNDPFVSSCQDCHMPSTNGQGCVFADPRDDLPTHHMNGGNTWVLNAVRSLYPDYETGLTADSVADSIQRAHDMLAAASDLELYEQGPALTTRLINQTGHKLPTGYPEGRRMWINVVFKDAKGQTVSERGAYDDATAALTQDTKVYEAKLGLDAYASNLLGLPEGVGFHFAANNKWFFDNRIPPRGFTNANFESVQAAPVGYTYPDGQYWDDSGFAVPAGAVTAEVSVYYQTTTKEYIEFLRDENVTNNAGQVAYDQWVLHGKSAPALMDSAVVNVCAADINDDDMVNGIDVGVFLQNYQMGTPLADYNLDGYVNGVDIGLFLQAYSTGC